MSSWTETTYAHYGNKKCYIMQNSDKNHPAEGKLMISSTTKRSKYQDLPAKGAEQTITQSGKNYCVLHLKGLQE